MKATEAIHRMKALQADLKALEARVDILKGSTAALPDPSITALFLASIASKLEVARIDAGRAILDIQTDILRNENS